MYWERGKRPSKDMLRSWFHVAPSEEFSVEFDGNAAKVRARGRNWLVTWSTDGKVRLDGEYRDAWTWEYRRDLKKGCGPCQRALDKLQSEERGKQ